jgi:hypothetical protein
MTHSVQPATTAPAGPQADDWTLRPGETAPEPGPGPHKPAVFDSSTHLLLTDVRAASLLLNELRIITIRSVFGVDRRQANVMTLFATLAVAGAAHDRVRRLLAALPAPGTTELLEGWSGADYLVRGIGGPAAAETPGFTSLVALGVVGALAAPTIRRTLHDAEAALRRSREAFRHRYGRAVSRVGGQP